MMKGQSFLALVLLIGAIVAAIGVTIAFFASTFVDSGFGYQASAQAYAAAASGVQDALLQLDRNSNFSGSYSLPVGSTTVAVIVTDPTPGSSAKIVSSATVSNHTSKLTVLLSENATTSQFTVVSWQATQ
jgi:hypothetical protein